MDSKWHGSQKGDSHSVLEVLHRAHATVEERGGERVERNPLQLIEVRDLARDSEELPEALHRLDTAQVSVPASGLRPQRHSPAENTPEA